MQYLFAILYVIFSSLGMVLIKKGGRESVFDLTAGINSLNISCYFIIGLMMYCASFILWILILQRFSLTYISPVAYGVVFVMISVLSWVILGEQLSIRTLVGGLIIIVGVFVASI